MLVIYAHPNKDGHCGYIYQQVCNYLTHNKISYSVIDLYDIGYNPSLRPDEHYTSGNNSISEENRNFQQLIINENSFIFIYPTWWQNMPAVLKGFCDRVFVPGFAYKFKKGIPIKLLKNKKAVLLTTTGGPKLISKLLFKSRSIKVLRDDVLRFCGFRSKGVIIGSARMLTPEKKVEIDKVILRTVKYLIKDRSSSG